MADALFLSRLQLRRDAPPAALAPVLAPDDDNARIDLGHRLLWWVFSDGPSRRRDFLWREEDRGRYLALSRRPPQDCHGLFEIETNSFDPALSEGDHLRFALRANAVATRKDESGKARRRDLVLEGLRQFPKAEFALHRDRIATEVGASWLRAQGEKLGFDLQSCAAIAYRKVKLQRAIVLGQLDLKGTLKVRSPELFLQSLAHGFGKAKGFGCGLMLIRRAY
ncbi:MAG TPA: type I-E CRISPR-associated protein Cas6/Cse3/CasE [Candidatus Acidoferrum sp.]|nr:type I-E CRISPR-associated protein Cas6/Cse3/CasE [Candidatus Acidoferrum sp.]